MYHYFLAYAHEIVLLQIVPLRNKYILTATEEGTVETVETVNMQGVDRTTASGEAAVLPAVALPCLAHNLISTAQKNMPGSYSHNSFFNAS